MKNIFDSRFYQFILFTFVLKPLHKIVFTNFTENFKQKAKILWEKNLSMNDSKIIQGKLSDSNISIKSSKTKPDTIVMYVCDNCKNPKRVQKTKQKWIII